MPSPGLPLLQCLARSVSALAGRCRSEAGVTLITAVMALSILSAAGASVVYFSSANTRSSAYAADHQNALDFAEAGMNFARSTLWQAADPSDPNSVPTTTQQVEGFDVTYFGTFDAATQIWTLTGRAEIPNPTGAAPIIRTTSSKVRITTGTQGSTNNAIWTYLYQDDPNFCAEVSNNVSVEIPVYTRGDLCVSNNATIESNTVQVLGNVEIGNNGSIGSPSTYIDAAHIAGQCKYGNGGSGQWHTECDERDRIYANDRSKTPDSLTKPAVDLPHWYANAAPGPGDLCPGLEFDNDGLMNESLPQVDLTPATPYDCSAYDQDGQMIGQLSWIPGHGALPGTLTISGVIFFDGPVKLNNNANAVYEGKAVIYATGQVMISNNAKLCGTRGCLDVEADGSCMHPEGCWNPNVDMLVFVAGTSSVDDGFVVRNNTTVTGPVIARRIRAKNNAIHKFTPFATLLPGMPASSTTSTTLENVDGSFTSS